MNSRFIKNSGIIPLTLLLVLGVSIFFENAYSYGYIIQIVFFLLFVLTNTFKNNIKNGILLGVLLFPVFLVNPTEFPHFLLTWMTFFSVFSVFDSVGFLYISEKKSKEIVFCGIIYILLFFILMLDPNRYSTNSRYYGLLPSITVSSSVVSLFLVFILEHFKKTPRAKIVFFAVLLSFVIILISCKTRSIFFIFPYLVYSSFIIFRRRKHTIAVSLITGGLFFVLFVIIANNADSLRLSVDETSILTRWSIYEIELDGIKKSFYLKPNGFNSCNLMIQSEFGDEFSPHNDLLAYWYDLGFIWFAILGLLVRKNIKFARKSGSRMLMVCFSFFICSLALHNIMFSMYVWPIVLMILFEIQKNRC